MADPGRKAVRAGPEMLAESPIPFHFEVTWRSLQQSLALAGEDVAVSKTVQRAPAPNVEAKEWEMVLPRMKRPAPLAPRPDLDAPRFATAAGRASRRWMVPVGAAVLAPLALAALYWTEQRSAPAAGQSPPAIEMGGAGWISEWASDPNGSARGRQISLYRPSMMMSDYRIEFAGRIERGSLGWVFRVADSRNYYAGKLEAVPPGLAITRFAVIRGIEGPHIQRVLPISAVPGAMLKIRLDASGPRFTVYVQNQVVEDWEDDRLKSGGVGFLNEREERGQVGSVQISFPRGARP